MVDVTWRSGPYTLGKLARDAAAHIPSVVRAAPDLVAGFRGPDQLRSSTRAVLHLRLAKVLGCPVCRAIFPGIARRAGLSTEEIDAALRGDPQALPVEAGAALAWVEAMLPDGEQPPEVPELARRLSERQRAHLATYLRLDLVVHSTGLMFLPHRMIERAWSD